MNATSIKGKDVVGLRVLSVNDGKQIETVGDIIYDPSEQRVRALLVASGGIFSKPKAIAIQDVLSIGRDAVMVQDQDAVVSLDELPKRVHEIADSKDNLAKTRVVTQEGTELGQVSDIIFNSVTGSVEQLEVSQGGIKNLSSGKKSIRPEDIITVGSDATIVSAFTEIAFDAQAQEGGAKGVLNSAKQAVTDVGAAVGEKVSAVTDSAKDKLETTKHNPDNQAKWEQLKDKASDIKDTTVNKASELKDTTMSKGAELKDAAAMKGSQQKDTAADKVSSTSETHDNTIATPVPAASTLPQTNVVHSVNIEKQQTTEVISPKAENGFTASN